MQFNFEKLDVYAKSKDFASHIYSVTRNFPKEEQFGVTSQLRRAAISISANIAEGSSRTKKDFRRFIDIARGSAYECVVFLDICLSQKYISKKDCEDIKGEVVTISKMLSGLKRSLG